MTGLTQIRWLIGFAIFGLVISGLTAFPLKYELDLLASLVTDANGQPRIESFPGLTEWVLRVRDGLTETYSQFPFIAYGTDWLAFGHIIIALFFVLPFRDPVRYAGVIQVGMIASILVFPLALICGQFRGIPFFWRLIDCCFGVVCFAVLWWTLAQIRKLPQNES